MRMRIFICFLAALALPVLAWTASAEDEFPEPRPIAGTSGSTFSDKSRRAPEALGTVAASHNFPHAQFASGGVGLRNQPGGAIEVSGAVKPVKAAFLYWAVITKGPPRTPVKSLRIQRILPARSQVAAISGTAVGSGPGPCWKAANGGDTITIFRGAVPVSVADGNGTYLIRLNPDAAGSTGGEDPFAASPLPAWSGATLVVIGAGSGKVSFYDSGLAGKTFLSRTGVAYSLPLGIDASEASRIIFHSIGADGQSGDGAKSLPATASETMSINGIKVAGAGSPGNDGGWNGTAAAGLPQLWDNTGYDVTGAARALAGNRLSISIAGPADGDDCLTPVANVVATFPVTSEALAARRPKPGLTASPTTSAALLRMPDLTVTSGNFRAVNGNRAIVGHKRVKFEWTQLTENKGNAAAPKSKTDVSIDEGDISFILGEFSIPRLAPGQFFASVKNVWFDFPGFKFGTYPVSICADSLHRVAESDENNNCKKPKPIHLVPKSFSGTVTGASLFVGTVFINWRAQVTYNHTATIPLGDGVNVDYTFTDVKVRYTVSGSNTGCTWSGTRTDQPPVQGIRLFFGNTGSSYTASNFQSAGFTIPTTIQCPNAEPIVIALSPPIGWFLTGQQPFANPGLTALDGELQTPPHTFSWNLTASD